MKLVAITGSIGCGKTTLANLVRKLGFVVWDVDVWCRNLYKKDDFSKLIVKIFPEVNENGKVNKKKLRELVFHDINKLRNLENLIHPFLKNNLLKLMHKNAKNNEVFFIDAALIFELGWDKYCDLIIVADVDKKIQKNRVMKRDNISSDTFDKIVNIQMDNDEKIKMSDVVIDTNQPLGILKVELLNIIKGL